MDEENNLDLYSLVYPKVNINDKPFIEEEIPSPIETSELPSVPIDPEDLADDVEQQLIQHGNTVPQVMKEGIKELTKVLNHNVLLNMYSHMEPLVYPAQTGSGKSLTLKMYISKIQITSSLVVVSQVHEAIKYCEFINQQSNDPNYARCYYSVNDKNKDHDLRVESKNLKNYRCIVITHALFKIVNQVIKIDHYKFYKDQQRDLIVIDEQLSFYENFIVKKSSIFELYEIIEIRNLLRELTKQEKLTTGEALISIISFFLYDVDELYKNTTDKKPLMVIKKEYFQLTFKEFIDNATDIQTELVQAAKESIPKILRNILKSGQLEKNITEVIEKIISQLISILEKDVVLYKDSFDQYFVNVKSIYNQLGSSVILDATSTINHFYNVAQMYQQYKIPSQLGSSEIQLKRPNQLQKVNANQFRQYSNLVIYQAKGYRQSRSSIYKGLPPKERKANIEMYVSYIHSILTDTKDKLLVITYKDIKLDIMSKLNDDRVQVIHWGTHVGTNDYNDCNKVIVIGWYFINQIEHLCTALHAIDDLYHTNQLVTTDMLYKLEISQLADDLIQGVMRSRARIVDTDSADCKPTEIYLFYADAQLYNDVLDIFTSQFPKSKVIDWKPIGIKAPKKKTKPEQKVDLIMAYLQQQESNGMYDVMLSDVIKNINYGIDDDKNKLNKSTVSRIMKDNSYYKEELAKRGYVVKNADNKSLKFILK